MPVATALGVLIAVALGGWLMMRPSDHGGSRRTAEELRTEPPEREESFAATPEDPYPPCLDLVPGLPPVDGPVSPQPQVAEAQQGRALLGFDSTAATTEAVLESGVPEVEHGLEDLRDDVWQTMGIPLSAAEIARFAVRYESEINDLTLRSVRAFQAAHPDRYAYSFLDQSAGGLQVVAVTRDVNEARAILLDGLPEAAVVRVQLAEHSLAELAEATDAYRAWAAENSVDVFVVPGAKSNRVEVAFADEGSRAAFVSRFGPDAPVCTGLGPGSAN